MTYSSWGGTLTAPYLTLARGDVKLVALTAIVAAGTGAERRVCAGWERNRNELAVVRVRWWWCCCCCRGGLRVGRTPFWRTDARLAGRRDRGAGTGRRACACGEVLARGKALHCTPHSCFLSRGGRARAVERTYLEDATRMETRDSTALARGGNGEKGEKKIRKGQRDAGASLTGLMGLTGSRAVRECDSPWTGPGRVRVWGNPIGGAR